MTELERWMNDHPPLSEPLTAQETAALREKVLARRPKLRVARLAGRHRRRGALPCGGGGCGAGLLPADEHRE